ncbi:hypothetical protein KC19_10G156400 [Ceratodon purpureus]|uniref:Uncharacterized protein n=1 Tax=Ceratodon purpureus TaxID=3225 RepID=A0A8T0GKS7_CERPU|nr:hypothetical protein KC19_10G156400 [Ceratodon purpureus]
MSPIAIMHYNFISSIASCNYSWQALQSKCALPYSPNPLIYRALNQFFAEGTRKP